MTALDEHHRRRTAWRGALAAALLNALGTPLDILVGRGIAGMPWWPSVLSSAVGITLAAVLLARRKALPSFQLSSSLFLVNSLAVACALWETGEHYAQLGSEWSPFQANKLGALTVALLAPEAWAGITSIVLYAGSAVLQFMLFSPMIRTALPQREPWILVAFGSFAIALLFYRRRRAAIDGELIRAKGEAAAASRLARLALSVRELANTPIQNIALATSLLRTKEPNLPLNVQRIERALERLRELDELLATHETDLQWKPGDESISALAELKEHKPRSASLG